MPPEPAVQHGIVNSLALILIFLSVYSYAVYPMLLILLNLFFKKKVRTGDVEPTVSIIIAAYNEESKIRDKLRNTMELDYPRDKIQFIVASDASSDRTEEIVREFPEVQLLRAPQRGGKERAQRMAIESATGEILVFTDAGTILDADGIRKIVRNFADQAVGAVSSRDQVLSSHSGNAEDVYVRYEMLLRRLESDFDGVVGLSGSFFAARREVCSDWSEDLTSDFNTVFLAKKKGLRAVSDDQSVGYYRDIQKGQSEYNRKVRTLIHGIHAFMKTLELLNVFRYGVFSWQLASHKLMRWLVPLFLAALFAVSIAGTTTGSRFCSALFLLQILFYGASLLGFVWEGARKWFAVKIPYYFVSVNVAILLAWIGYFKGERMRVWNPTVR